MPTNLYGQYKTTNMQFYSYNIDLSEWHLTQDYIFYYSEGRPTRTVDNSISNLSVFPNPASKMITIEFPSSSAENKTIEILDPYGKVVSSTQSSSSIVEINISEFSNGIYFVHVLYEKGVITNKFIKSDH
ncbi:MAG: T9SS type A sorting domain-containing protein [Bacteroidales bacterium]|nr:T9SS type A sorting domain-containing protein [Bacteroidales bacterium]